MKKLVTCLVLLATISFSNGQIDPIVQQAIDDLVQNEFITKADVPALGLAIVKDGEVLYTQGYGYRDLENSVPADNDTLFFIGSITKSMTATIAIKILSETFPDMGEAVLDTPISTLVPQYKFMLSDRFRSEYTTFRDLLAHRVGERVQDMALLLGALGDSSNTSYGLRYTKEVFPFRTQFVYNNGHLTLVGDILAELTGISYDALLEDFLAQLGMNKATYVKESDDHNNMPDRAIGYYYPRNETYQRYNTDLYKRFTSVNAAGGVLSSPNDFAKYLQFHLNNGRVGDVQVVAEEVMKWLQKSSNPLTPLTWKTEPGQKVYFDYGYSLALFLGSYDGWQTIMHSGYLPPFNSLFSFYPALNIGIFTSASSIGKAIETGVSHNAVHFNILEILQGGQPIPQAKFPIIPDIELGQRQPDVVVESTSSTKEQKRFQEADIIGSFGNGMFGEFRIFESVNDLGEAQLYMEYSSIGKGWLRQVSGDTWAIDFDSDYLQDYYLSGVYDIPEITLTYDGVDTLTYSEPLFLLEAVFVRNLHVADLPVRPWGASTCGPINII